MMHFCILPVTFIKEGVEIRTAHYDDKCVHYTCLFLCKQHTAVCIRYKKEV